MKKRLLSVVLATALVSTLFAGCGSSEAAAPAAEAATEEAATEEVAEEAPAEEAEEAPAEATELATSAIDNLIAATEGTVALTVWASEEDQDLTTQLIGEFEALYPDVTFDIQLGKESEANTKDDILKDVEAAPDVFAFADDQINDLVRAGALQEVVANYTYDVKAENVAGSVEAATVDGKLYAYPMTADNGYFMFYDSSVFSAEDVQSLDTMIEKAQEAGKTIAIEVSNAWYTYAFFKGAGFNLELNEDGSNSCDWDGAGATDVAQAIIDAYATGVVVNMDDATTVTGIQDGTVCAAVNGTWNAQAASEAWGENYAAAKLPTFTVAGNQVQMASFSGCKLIGVNPRSQFVGWSMLLAEYLTSYDAQVKRFEQRELGPANIEAAASDAVQSNPAIAALAAQAEFATPQRVGGNYWEPINTLGKNLADGNPDGTDLQEMLETAVAGVTAPIE